MAIISKPIPALYCVYVLRSTIRHASLYVGSTPNPPRRLKQHNGLARGGAARTARESLRPWEMIGLVSGFPSMLAALKFEWALDHPHISLHIPSESRLAVSKQRKRNGQPKKPHKSLTSIISNLHVLLHVSSFARWPLTLHFFVPEAHRAWADWREGITEPLRASLRVVTDFGAGCPELTSEPEPSQSGQGKWGIHALPLDYSPMEEYVGKGNAVFAFERQGDCIFCHDELETGKGLYAICPNPGCEGVGHLSCWGRHTLPPSEQDFILPIEGKCPQCDGPVCWLDMMKEMTLRARGQKEVDRILKKRRRAKAS